MAITGRQIMAANNRIIKLSLSDPFGKFLGNVPQNTAWKCIVYGPAGGGKSTFLLQLADVLGLHGKVLYGNLEESVGRGTLQAKLLMINSGYRVNFLEKSTLDEFFKELDTGEFKYCIVDSVSEQCKTTKQYTAFKERIEKYENVTFFYVLHATKTKLNYKGPSELAHDVDIEISVANMTAKTGKNRLQGGENKYVYNILKRTIQNAENEEINKKQERKSKYYERRKTS